MYNVSVPIPDEVLYDAHLSKKLTETYVRQAAALFYYQLHTVFVGERYIYLQF